jgi:hypothetical protein
MANSKNGHLVAVKMSADGKKMHRMFDKIGVSLLHIL